MVQVSVVIITYNEERNISRCIESVKSWAAEILVVDSGSTDQTCEIASQMGARIMYHPFEGHIEQKNYAAAQATYDWVLSLDADEAVDEVLSNTIQHIMEQPTADGYTMNRLNNYCGTYIRHGAWYPDKKLRLWNRHKGRWTGINPHDKFEMHPGCVIQHIPGHILHYSYQTVAEHKKKALYFANLAAKAYLKAGKRSSVWKLIIHPIGRFIRDYFIKAGFLDGRKGWIIATITAYEVFQKYLLLLKLQKQHTSEF
ncbi:MAG: glycosyltransferase family 2 protein [Flavobacteriales bacterium]|nr:glycosyltransferase family 2 protein [Flavobacteriales bacterium]